MDILRALFGHGVEWLLCRRLGRLMEKEASRPGGELGGKQREIAARGIGGS